MTRRRRLLQAALAYRRRGYSVIPLKPRGKSPLIRWREFQERLATEQEIRGWWRTWPEANVGIVTGRVSNLVVVDVDPERGGNVDEVLKKYPTDCVVQTGGGGYHLYYRYPDDAK
jgi:hypothetical protein